MTAENWYTMCGAGFGLRGVSECDSAQLGEHLTRHQSDYGALLRRYRAPSHPYLRYRERVVWRRGSHAAAEPKANLYLDPVVARHLLRGADPLPGRVYLILSLVEDTPGRVVRKVAANVVLAEAGPGGSLETVDRRALEDMLLRIASWPDEDPPIAGEWGLNLEPLPEELRPLAAAALRGERIPDSPTFVADDALGPVEVLPPREAALLPGRFGDEIRIRIKERAVFPDGLEVHYWGTSHKRTRVGDPSCAMPHLDLTRDGMTEMIEPHWRRQGPKEWGDSVIWEGYGIELTGLDYDEEVRVRVTARPGRSGS